MGYRTLAKTMAGYTPFHLVYGEEVVFPIECEIPSLKLAIELLPNTYIEYERLLHLHSLDETRIEASLNVDTNKKQVKSQYDKESRPRVFSKGDLVLVYDQDNDKIGKGKFVPKWFVPLVIKRVLEKGAYELVNYDGEPLSEIINYLYLNKYFS